MPLHQAAIEGTIVGNDLSSVWIYAVVAFKNETKRNSHADNRSEISATRIDEWNEDTEREPNGGIEVNASPCIVDTGEKRNSVIRGSREDKC